MVIFICCMCTFRHFHLPRGLRLSSAASVMLILWVQIPPEACMSVCCECSLLSGRDLCDELITRSEEPYQLWYVMCDLDKPVNE